MVMDNSLQSQGQANTIGPPAVEIDTAKIDGIFADLDQCHLPGAAVGIALHGRPVYRKGFGLASMELPVTLSPGIKMRIGSTTKHFACLAYMLLCEESKAALDDPITRSLPELPAVAQNVSMRHLMGNVSGLRDVTDIKLQFSGLGGRSVSRDELLSLYCGIKDAQFEPGTAWMYNNGGFVLLSIAIERIAGVPLERFMQERIFEPIGMHDTLMRPWDTDFVSNSATSHMSKPGGGFERVSWGLDWAGGGAMVSTVNDMLRWLAHMNSPVVGNHATWTAIKTAQTLSNGVSTGYGLGLFIQEYRGVEVLSHPGSWTGANAQMLKVPVLGLDIVVMVNRYDVNSTLLADRVLDACISGLAPPGKPAAPRFLRGLFRSPNTGLVVELFPRDDEQIAAINGMDMTCEYDADGILRPAGVFGYVKQSVSLSGDPECPSSISITDLGNRDDLFAVAPPSKGDRQRVIGHYHSEETDTSASIASSGDGLRLIMSGRFGSMAYQLVCLGDGIFHAKQEGVIPWGGILAFDSDLAEFRFSSFFTWSLPFTRCDS